MKLLREQQWWWWRRRLHWWWPFRSEQNKQQSTVERSSQSSSFENRVAFKFIAVICQSSVLATEAKEKGKGKGHGGKSIKMKSRSTMRRRGKSNSLSSKKNIKNRISKNLPPSASQIRLRWAASLKGPTGSESRWPNSSMMITSLGGT